MAKKTTSARKTTRSAPAKVVAGSSSARPARSSRSVGDGKHLVIVESPAKAKTINKYLGPDYIVKASIGHVRDLPKRNPKGVKAPVPGVDIEAGFAPHYEAIEGKGKTIAELRKLAKAAPSVWLATDLDREGEAIAWHLQEALSVPADKARRVVFNAITADEIHRAFDHPRSIHMDKVNAQQARRILDRIVGYQVSPVLWKKVAGGLSAGRVQSVAVRLIVEREREILAFIPQEQWKITGCFTVDLKNAPQLHRQWRDWLAAAAVEKANDPRATAGGATPTRTLRERNQWLSDHASLSAELVEVRGAKHEPVTADEALALAQAAGFILDDRKVDKDPRGKGPAAQRVTLIGHLRDDVPWKVRSIETRKTHSRPNPPFITSTLQQAAANVLGMTTLSTMRTAQSLYEGVDVAGLGSVGLITYMRTDSTHLSAEALSMVRSYITDHHGPRFLPDKPNFFRSSNKAAQEAHEAIRPTDVKLTPERVRSSLDERQYKLYRLIWQRFVASQMTPAEWDSTVVHIIGGTEAAQAVFKTTGRTLRFKGFYEVAGVPQASDELTLPPLVADQPLAALDIDPQQKFTSPPPRYTEASLVKKLEAEGIGRPSTYASIIGVIQDRKYVEKDTGGRFMATDLGMVVTDKLMEGFPHIMDVGYTRKMEAQLDAVEEQHRDWVQMLQEFYDPFKQDLDRAMDRMTHAKAELEPAPHLCPTCGAATVYRLGKNGRFLSCTRYPDCKYAAPIDREGNPVQSEVTDIACPECKKPMVLRKGRFGPFLSCSDYPACKGIVKIDRKGGVALPKSPPLTTDLACSKCQSPLNLRSSKRGPWLSCSAYPKCKGKGAWKSLDEKQQKALEIALANHEKANPAAIIHKVDGSEVPEGYKPLTAGASSSTDEADGSVEE